MNRFFFLFCLLVASVIHAQDAPIRLGDAGKGAPVITRADNGDVHVLWLDKMNKLVHSKRTAGSASFAIIDSLTPVVSLPFAEVDTINSLLCCAVRNDTVYLLCRRIDSVYKDPMHFVTGGRFRLISLSKGAPKVTAVWSSQMSINTSYYWGEGSPLYSSTNDFFIQTSGQNVMAGFTIIGVANDIGIGPHSSIVLLVDAASQAHTVFIRPSVFNPVNLTHHIGIADSSFYHVCEQRTSETQPPVCFLKRYHLEGTRIDSISTMEQSMPHRFVFLPSRQNAFNLLWNPSPDGSFMRSQFSETGRTDFDTLIRSFKAADAFHDLQYVLRKDGNSLLLWLSHQPSNTIHYRMLSPRFETLGMERFIHAGPDINNPRYRSAVGLDKSFGVCWSEPAGVYYQELSDEFLTEVGNENIVRVASTPELAVYPNPLRDRGIIRYSVPKAAPVRLALYDMFGREVRSFIHANETAGMHDLAFSTGDLPTGLYSVVMTQGKLRSATTIALVK